MPIINRGDDYFATGTYTGNGTSQTISGLRFQPDFVWIKGRSGATDHALYDAVRGAEKRLESNQTDAEVTSDGGVTAFTSDGFTVGSLAQVNTNGATYVYWAWKANGTGVTNTAGSITSTVSANTTAGFSIVTYTGNATSGATVGHGLGVPIDFMIIKNRGASTSWIVKHKVFDASTYLQLNSTAATESATGAGLVSNSTTFTLNNTYTTQNASANYVAYCFAEVAGYSKFGSYTGNGSTDGPFIFTGFRPRYVLVKRTDTTSLTGWFVMDTARAPTNLVQPVIYPNWNYAEETLGAGTGGALDILSNGFKYRGSYADVNANNGTYIYAAFSEVGFKYALGR